MRPDIVFVMLGGFGCIAVIVNTLATTWLKVRTARHESLDTRDSEIAVRLQRMESALEALAVETERNGEGQRYLVKLLSERGPSLPASRARESITPH